MNQQLSQDFMHKIKHTVDDLSKEVIAPKIDTKEAIDKIKLIRTNLTHLHNIFKIEETLEKER